MKKTLLTLARLTPWFLVLLIAFHLVVFEGWKDLTRGRFHRRAHDLFWETSNVTAVEVVLLQGETGQRQPEVFMMGSLALPTYGSKRLEGEALADFLDLWKWQSPEYRAQALCHGAAYGFRLYSGSALAAETTVCWECSNFTLLEWPFKGSTYGFAANNKLGKQLLEFCDRLLPYARGPNK